MSGVWEILEKIRTKPGIYLGRPSVSDLFMFLVGYECARSELGVEPTQEEDEFYGEFQPWLQNKLGMRTVSSWAKIILLSCHDEKAGLEKFFNLLDEFKQRNKSLNEENSKKIKSYELVNGNIGNELSREQELNQVAEEVKYS